MTLLCEQSHDPIAAAANRVADHLADSANVEVTWELLRGGLDRAAAERGEWGGAPIPVSHVRLKMEPRFPFKLDGKKFGDDDAKDAPTDDYELLNTFVCESRPYARAYICREANGKSRVYFSTNGAGQRLTFWINTLGVAAQHVWDAEAEDRALQKLRALVTAHAFNCYRLCGSFLETSKRSGVQYLFRKLRPTIALRPDARDNIRILAILCLHPLGYYEQSWAGVMCPTDDVIAHLMLMRGDEHFYWKKSNQHDSAEAGAGI